MEDGIARLDVGEECVAEPLALRGALHQARDVRHVQERRNFAEINGEDHSLNVSSSSLSQQSSVNRALPLLR